MANTQFHDSLTSLTVLPPEKLAGSASVDFDQDLKFRQVIKFVAPASTTVLTDLVLPVSLDEVEMVKVCGDAFHATVELNTDKTIKVNQNGSDWDTGVHDQDFNNVEDQHPKWILIKELFPVPGTDLVESDAENVDVTALVPGVFATGATVVFEVIGKRYPTV